VGTVVRTGEDEDPIGVMTVLNTHQHKQQPFLQQIRQYMVDKCGEAAAAAQQQRQQQELAAARELLARHLQAAARQQQQQQQ